MEFFRYRAGKIGGRWRGETMLDLFYVGVVIVFFVLLWGFTNASERM
jgi:hypothetical protein